MPYLPVLPVLFPWRTRPRAAYVTKDHALLRLPQVSPRVPFLRQDPSRGMTVRHSSHRASKAPLGWASSSDSPAFDTDLGSLEGAAQVWGGCPLPEFV